MALQTIDHIDVAGQRVLMRVDFNVPLDDAGHITDDRRIEQALPSIRSVIDRGGRLILISHLGRPGGTGLEPEFSLRPAADRLRELLGPEDVPVHFPGDRCTGEQSRAAAESLADGEILVLENLRFEPGEKSGDAAFAEELAGFADVYCNNAFGTAHRSDASMVALPEAVRTAGGPCVAGLLLSDELRYLQDVIAAPARPFVAVLGGAKVSDKLAAIQNLLTRVDEILIGGAMAYTFLEARGERVGSSLVEKPMVVVAREMLHHAESADTATIRLPQDHVIATAMESDAETKVVSAGSGVDDGWMGLDIGPATRQRYTGILTAAKTIVWNGPMGVFELAPFEAGTEAIAEAIIVATEQNKATSIVGGGDSAAAAEKFGVADRFSHVSTGGGASLELLEGKRFASIAALDTLKNDPATV